MARQPVRTPSPAAKAATPPSNKALTIPENKSARADDAQESTITRELKPGEARVKALDSVYINSMCETGDIAIVSTSHAAELVAKDLVEIVETEAAEKE